MSIVFSGIVPSSPFLLDEMEAVRDTELVSLKQALVQFEQEFYLTKPDLCIIFSSTAATMADMCTIHANPKFTGTLAHFGNFSKEVTWKGSPDTAARLLHESYELRLPLRLESEALLDDETTVVLELIGYHLPNIKVLPIGSMINDRDTNVAIGRLLREFASTTTKRVAFIAAGTLAATHSAASPFAPISGSTDTDTRIREALCACDSTTIQSISVDDAERYMISLMTPLVLLSGVCQHVQGTYTELNYSIAHGIGYTLGYLSVT